MTKQGGRPRGGLEREVLAALAAADGPMTAAEVQAELGGDLAYTTVMTTLSRLHDKAALEREPAGRAYAYRLAAAPDAVAASVTARRMRRLLDADQDRGDVLARFVADLRPEDGRLLADLLAEERGTPAPGADD